MTKFCLFSFLIFNFCQTCRTGISSKELHNVWYCLINYWRSIILWYYLRNLNCVSYLWCCFATLNVYIHMPPFIATNTASRPEGHVFHFVVVGSMFSPQAQSICKQKKTVNMKQQEYILKISVLNYWV